MQCFSLCTAAEVHILTFHWGEIYPQSQAAFYVGYPEDLRRGFPNRLAYWRTIVIFGAKQRKTEHERSFHICKNARRVNIWENIYVYCIA